MRGNLSLRGRLTAIILTPLICIAVAVGIWAVLDAQARADDRFNRALLSAALAVSRDVAVSDGDALTPETNALLRDSFSGPLFYHVYAPDGAFVTGYATPPVPTMTDPIDSGAQEVFEGLHQSRDVIALRFIDAMEVQGLAGDYTVTVWQDRSFRNALVRDLVRGTILVISLLVASVGFVVWFGVSYGLRPLNDLEEAIAQRSTDELTPIQRHVPAEVTGIVGTLNTLFSALAQNMAAQADFISNAAHQLRNPIAGILALAEATKNAPDEEEAKRRTDDLLNAAREASELSQKLLLMERAKAFAPADIRTEFDFSAALAEVAKDFRPTHTERIHLECAIEEGMHLVGDETMIREAIKNLLDNALKHGGPDLSHIKLNAYAKAKSAIVEISDDGVGISSEDQARASKRFEQLGSKSGSGLGLAIVEAIAQAHGGELCLKTQARGLRVVLSLDALA
ncbi:MAG: sensor histidine kinase [Pseudomonadota bacterium]